MLPAVKPDGLTDVQLERFAEPERDGQRAMLVFGDDTVYVCSRPAAGVPDGATPCPYPCKQDLLTVESSRDVETVYALDEQSSLIEGKGGSEAGRQAIRDAINVDAEMQAQPAWFVQVIEGDDK